MHGRQYDPRVVAPQTETVALDATLVERAQREADKRRITLKQLVDDALERRLASEGQVERRRAAGERLRGLFADANQDRSATDELIADRRAEARAEDCENEARQRRAGR